jgi:hypothetical protein
MGARPIRSVHNTSMPVLSIYHFGRTSSAKAVAMPSAQHRRALARCEIDDGPTVDAQDDWRVTPPARAGG